MSTGKQLEIKRGFIRNIMKTLMIHKFRNRVWKLVLMLMVLSACTKDDYYVEGGVANGRFDGSVLQYLESKPVEFDSVVQIVKLAGLDDYLTTDELTFFAPRDENIKELIGALDRGGLNRRLYNEGKDTVKVLSDVDSLIWRKYLQRHMFRGKNKLMDYPQIDFGQQTIYPGQTYYSYNNSVSNIGVVYNDAGGVKYMGYRQLHISYIPDISRPTAGWRTVRVASSDIEADNGIVHVLDVNGGELGFDRGEIENEIAESKR